MKKIVEIFQRATAKRRNPIDAGAKKGIKRRRMKIFALCVHKFMQLSVGFLVHGFEQKTYRSESVVAGNHCRLFILHPPVVKVFAAVRKRHYKSGDAFPSAFAKILRSFPAVCDENLTFLHIAGVRNRIFVLFDQVWIACRFHYGNLNFFQCRKPP